MSPVVQVKDSNDFPLAFHSFEPEPRKEIFVRYTALDYVYQISMLQSHKRHEVLEALLLSARAHAEMFRKGNELMQVRNLRAKTFESMRC